MIFKENLAEASNLFISFLWSAYNDAEHDHLLKWIGVPFVGWEHDFSRVVELEIHDLYGELELWVAFRTRSLSEAKLVAWWTHDVMSQSNACSSWIRHCITTDGKGPFLRLMRVYALANMFLCSCVVSLVECRMEGWLYDVPSSPIWL